MEIANCILEYLKVLAWPIALIISIFIFKGSIIKLINRINKATLPGGFSLETYPGEIAQAKELSIKVQKENVKEQEESKYSKIPLTEANLRMIELGLAPSPSGLNIQYYENIAEEDPNLALAGVRIELENMLRNLAKGFKVKTNNTNTSNKLAEILYKRGCITEKQYKLIMSVINLCNMAIHGLEINTSQAKEVLNIASVLRDYYIQWLSWGFTQNQINKENNIQKDS